MNTEADNMTPQITHKPSKILITNSRILRSKKDSNLSKKKDNFSKIFDNQYANDEFDKNIKDQQITTKHDDDNDTTFSNTIIYLLNIVNKIIGKEEKTFLSHRLEEHDLYYRPPIDFSDLRFLDSKHSRYPNRCGKKKKSSQVQNV